MPVLRKWQERKEINLTPSKKNMTQKQHLGLENLWCLSCRCCKCAHRPKYVMVFKLSCGINGTYATCTGLGDFLASPSPIPEFRRTPQENHIADDKVRASSSSSSLFTLNLPNGLKGNIGRLQEIKWGYAGNLWNKKTLASPSKREELKTKQATQEGRKF